MFWKKKKKEVWYVCVCVQRDYVRLKGDQKDMTMKCNALSLIWSWTGKTNKSYKEHFWDNRENLNTEYILDNSFYQC